MPPHGTHVSASGSVQYLSRLKEIPENYWKTISLEYYRVALGQYRHRFHPVNDLALAPYISQARGASLSSRCSVRPTPTHLIYV
jgi:hypothetical protein